MHTARGVVGGLGGWGNVAALVALVLAGLAGACGSSGNAGPGDGGGASAGDATKHDDGGRALKPDGGSKLGMGQAAMLHVEPQNATLKATGASSTEKFTAYLGTSKTATAAAWSSNAPSIGSIDPMTGVFTATGLLGGPVTIAASASGQQASTQLDVFLSLTDDPGNVPTATETQLKGGGAADSAFAWLYPYDATVFPRGLLPPTLQFAGTAPDAVYLHVSFSELDYQGFYGASTAPGGGGQLTIPAQLWTTITETATATDQVKVQITKISGGQVTGPITETWTIAQGSLKGTVYYESRYSTPTDNGATMRIKPGAAQPDVLIGNCTVCHYVSADGSTIDATNDVGSPLTSATYSLTNDAGVLAQSPNETFTFGALYNDGSFLMACGSASIPGIGDDGAVVSHLYDTKTGVQIPANGWDGTISNGAMPTFSPDGKKIVFNHYDTGAGHSLALMDFDVTTYTFSGLLDVVEDPNHFLGWPTFTPDGDWVVYDADNRSDFATWGDYPGGSTDGLAGPPGQADLQVVQLGSMTTASLDLLNGVKSGKYYLPFGEAAEGHMNFDATILPIAAGGYYWVVFTSRREYGNTINTASPYYNLPSNQPGALPWRKKLWVAALDVDTTSTAAHDISHPAFYLPGQDEVTGNYRGFWVLSPCQGNGTSCGSGDECCSGFCRPQGKGGDAGADAMSSAPSDAGGGDAGGGDAGDAAVVVPPPTGQVCVAQPVGGCSNEYEKCAASSDCCQVSAGFQCIDGFCAQPGPK